MEASTGCRPGDLGLRSIHPDPVGAHPPGYFVNACRYATVKLQRCRRTTKPLDLGVVSIQIGAETMALYKQ